MRYKIVFVTLMLLGLLQTAGAQQDPVQYWHHSWENVSGQDRVTNYSSLCNNYKVLDASTSLSDSHDFGVGDNPEWDNGGYKWVVVKGEVTISRLIVIGEGHLILTDGSRLVCSDGVVLQGDGNSLSIYSQSSDEQEGRLEAKLSQSKFKKNAAIGCIDDYEVNGSPGGMGTLVIHGGVITATGNNRAAGIGGGEDRGIQPNGSVTIYGGTVTATGGYKAAGIGGGNDAGQGGPVTIYGGTVTATGGDGAAGIGGGYRYSNGGSGGQVKIYGGNVTVRGGHRASAIGAGENSISSRDLSSFTMEGGTVHASSDYESAICGTIAIRGGELIIRCEDDGYGLCGIITEISNATVDIEAAGGPGISNMSGTMTIRDSNIRSIGGKRGAGITGYFDRGIGTFEKSSTINIISGTVYAKGGAEGVESGAGIGTSGGNTSHITLNISGGTVTAIGQEGGAGIGGGLAMGNGTNRSNAHGMSYASSGGGAGIDVNITGGTVIAQAYSDYAQTIGAGKVDRYNRTYNKSGELHIGDNMSVKLGTSEEDATLVNVVGRVNACRETKKYVKIEACEHSGFSYSYVDETNHLKSCTYCTYTMNEAHSYGDSNTEDCACGKKFNEKTDIWTVTLYEATDDKATTYDNGTQYKVVKGQSFTLPENKNIDNLTFMDWLQDPATAPVSCEMKDEEFQSLTPAGATFTPEADITLYARYRCQYDTEWTWGQNDQGERTATVSVIWKNGDAALLNLEANVTNNTKEPTADNPDGNYTYYANASYTKSEGVEYQFSDYIDVPYIWNVNLSDNADNSSVLTENEGKLLKKITLSGRTLYKDGSWNTLCLPFDISISGSPLDGDGVTAQVIDTEKSQLDKEGHLSVTFVNAPEVIEAGTPFIIKWNAGSDLSSPDFSNVVISATSPRRVQFVGAAFEGQFSPFAITEENINEIIMLSDNNTLGYSKVTRTLRPFRAHFIAEKESGEGVAACAMLSYDLYFDDEGATAIKEIEGNRPLVNDNQVYDLQGRKITSSSLPKGIYIINGRKVFIH